MNPSLSTVQNTSWYRSMVRYKLYHLPFWIGYQLFWNVLFSWEYLFTSINLFLMLATSLTQAAGAYPNIYYLVPTLLKRGRYVRYVLGFLSCLAISSLLTGLCYYFTLSLVSDSWEVEDWWKGSQKVFVGAMISMAFTSMIAAMIVKLLKDWLKDQQRTQQLEKEKLETELKFLRSQFNPHFLFNTINSIHFLIRKDPKMASDTLSKFSDLLRYQLYECNEARIPLTQEVHYLSNFVALEQMRVSQNVAVVLDVSENVNGAHIAPFILMPFVENAFKHVSKGKRHPNFIRISLQQQPQQIRFCVEHSVEAGVSTQEAIHYGGIGLTNVRRRLDLLYTQQHALCIDEQPDTYSVDLTIDVHAED